MFETKREASINFKAFVRKSVVKLYFIVRKSVVKC